MTTNRFLLVSSKLFADNRRSILMGLGVYAGIMIVIGIWLAMIHCRPDNAAIPLYFIIMSAVWAVIASLSFSSLKSKNGKINELMLPATAAEKYWPRLIAIFVCTPIVIFLGYYLFAYFWMLSARIFMDNWYPFPGIDIVADHSDVRAMTVLMTTSFCTISFYTFGSVMWPRWSFLKSTGILIAIQIVFFSLITTIVTATNGRFLLGFDPDEESIFFIYNAIMTIIGVVLLYFGYRKFKNLQLV